MNEFFEIVQNIFNLFGRYMSIPAVIVGVGAILATQYLAPSSDPNKSLSTVPGTLVDRLLPFVGPLVATIVCVIIEWDRVLTPNDIVRGINSGIGSEFVLRIYFKSFSSK